MSESFAQRATDFAVRARAWAARHADLTSFLLIAFAVLRIFATLTVFSATADEPLHVTAGLQLVKEGRYGWQLENPPLPRLLFGSLISLGGAQFDPDRDPIEMMRWVFYSSGHYKTSLALARLGSVLLFIPAAICTWWLARRTLGREAAALATLLFTMQPVVLGFAGIANLDIACMTGVAIALVAFDRWMERPSAANAMLAGAAYGLSIGLKLSNLLFTAAACLAMFLVRPQRPWRRAAAAIAPAALAAFVALWATYGFAFGSLEHFDLFKPQGQGLIARVVAPLATTTPIPMPHLVVGLAGVAAFEGEYFSYAFGLRTHDGWWWYFTAALLLKTTLATLAFVVAGFRLTRTRQFAAWMAAVAAILVVAATSSLDLGVRYVLPVYVPLTLAATGGALAMLRHQKLRVRQAALLLVVWHIGASLFAHPDYFPYFNEAAGPRPGWALLDSNLDWGQDLLRLKRVVRERKVERIGIIDTGLHDFRELGFPPMYDINPWIPSDGWLAIGEHIFRMTEPDGGFWWLRGRRYERVGKSLRLYSP